MIIVIRLTVSAHSLLVTLFEPAGFTRDSEKKTDFQKKIFPYIFLSQFLIRHLEVAHLAFAALLKKNQ